MRNDGGTENVTLTGGAGDRVPGGKRTSAATRGGSLALKLGALVALIAAGTWAYYTNVTTARPAMDMTMRVTSGSTPYPVSLAPVERGTITGSVTYTGSVAAFNEEDVYPRVMGRIVDMPVYPGDAVRAGQVVARLDDVELGSRAQEAAAGAAAAAANVAQMDADVTAARHGVAQMDREVTMAQAEVAAATDGIAQMERELTMAEADAEHQEHIIVRDERLYQRGAIALQEAEATRAAVQSARAKVEAARARVRQQRAMATAAEAKLEAARARLDQARAMQASAVRKREAMAAMAAQSQAMQRTAEVVRDYVTIRTPSSGYVVKRLVAPGVLVQPGMALLKIAQIDRVRLQANVGERDLASIRVGSPVGVSLAGAQPALTARVTSVFPFIDPGARTGVVEAIVDNAHRRFLPGQYVQMQFVTGERAAALTVPRGAVSRLGARTTVWVEKDGKAESRAVATGLEGPDRIEIVQGVAEGERIVVRGHEGLYAGARVTDIAGPPPARTGHEGHAAGPAKEPAAARAAAPAADGHSGHGGAADSRPTPPAAAAPAKAGTPAASAPAHAGHGSEPTSTSDHASHGAAEAPAQPKEGGHGSH
jgi:RND family efflux transporter MFP subunit